MRRSRPAVWSITGSGIRAKAAALGADHLLASGRRRAVGDPICSPRRRRLRLRHQGSGAVPGDARQALGIDPSLVLAAYGDPWHYLRSESQLPVNVDPLDGKLEDKEERARLAKVFQRGLNEPVGFALLINRRMDQKGPVWLSSTWPLRQERLLLAPATARSATVTLGSLPGSICATIPSHGNRTRSTRAPLPPHAGAAAPAHGGAAQAGSAPPSGLSGHGRGPTEFRKKANPRGGSSAPPCAGRGARRQAVRLHAADEHAGGLSGAGQRDRGDGGRVNMPVIMEGHPPPRDPRLNSMAVTPDPGVIEVNIHPPIPGTSWCATTPPFTRKRVQARLGTEKFMLDGRHVGTGGGNHVVVGEPPRRTARSCGGRTCCAA